MKVLVLLFLVALTSGTRVNKIYSIGLASQYFEEFIDTYDKQYGNEAEKTQRFEIFKHNLELINKKNLESKAVVYGINKFTDLTNEEFISLHTGLRGDELRGGECTASTVPSSNAPDACDWKAKGVISKVKDQKMCGSCWAFSAIGNVEAYYAIKHQELLDLSEQQLVDCDKGSQGCDGTSKIDNPFVYLRENGAMQEQDYPYQARNGNCRFDKSKVKANVADCLSYTPTTEDELKNILYNVGPVSIALDASGMQSYQGHVLTDCPYMALNHAVLIVGYGSENGTPYWLIKNSWGEQFGEDGFIKIQRGVNACGLMHSNVLKAEVN